MLEMTILVLGFLFICIIRTFLYPIIYVLQYTYPWMRRRIEFEQKNLTDPASIPFRKKKLKADLSFEISSEGELEQVRPIINIALEKKKLIELVYSSDSVETKCLKLYQDNIDQIRLYRLPLLTFSFFPWPGSQNIFRFISSKKLILCRYDLYPELMLLGSVGPLSFILVSATLKNKNIQHKLLRRMYKGLYNLFDNIICATNEDQNQFRKLRIKKSKLGSYDFRIEQIKKRLNMADIVLNQTSFFRYYSAWISKTDMDKRILFGSIWPDEMDIFKDKDFIKEIKDGKFKCVLAPHKLGENHVKTLLSKIDGELPYYVLKNNMEEKEIEELFNKLNENPGILIILVPGILCELYKFVGNAFVGGGHGRSIHSVLEPYVGLCQVFCGPKTHRSTEYDLIRENSSNEIHIVEELKQFYKVFTTYGNQKLDIPLRENLFDNYEKQLSEITNNILEKDHFYV